MKLYFIRHGQSEQNKEGIHQDQDTKLSEVGKKQSEEVAKRLVDKNIDKVLSSPFPRAKQTAETISGILDVEIEVRQELREAVWPSELVGLQATDPESVRIRQEILQNSSDPNYRYSDEESFRELSARANELLNYLLKNYKEENLVCVSHGLIQKIFVGLILFEEEFNSTLYYKFRKNSWMDNTGITEIDYSDEHGWSLQTWNDRSHL